VIISAGGIAFAIFSYVAYRKRKVIAEKAVKASLYVKRVSITAVHKVRSSFSMSSVASQSQAEGRGTPYETDRPMNSINRDILKELSMEVQPTGHAEHAKHADRDGIEGVCETNRPSFAFSNNKLGDE